MLGRCRRAGAADAVGRHALAAALAEGTVARALDAAAQAMRARGNGDGDGDDDEVIARRVARGALALRLPAAAAAALAPAVCDAAAAGARGAAAAVLADTGGAPLWVRIARLGGVGEARALCGSGGGGGGGGGASGRAAVAQARWIPGVVLHATLVGSSSAAGARRVLFVSVADDDDDDDDDGSDDDGDAAAVASARRASVLSERVCVSDSAWWEREAAAWRARAQHIADSAGGDGVLVLADRPLPRPLAAALAVCGVAVGVLQRGDSGASARRVLVAAAAAAACAVPLPLHALLAGPVGGACASTRVVCALLPVEGAESAGHVVLAAADDGGTLVCWAGERMLAESAARACASALDAVRVWRADARYGGAVLGSVGEGARALASLLDALPLCAGVVGGAEEVLAARTLADGAAAVAGGSGGGSDGDCPVPLAMLVALLEGAAAVARTAARVDAVVPARGRLRDVLSKEETHDP